MRTADSVGDALGAAVDALAAAGVESPRLDAELMLATAAGNESGASDRRPRGAAGRRRRAREFGAMVRRRLRREPVAYILGRRWFRELELQVDGRVLIPRPETELLVEVALELRPRRVLEVGTGSGAVALALAAELPEVEVIATDSSPAALEVARANAERLGLAERVSFVEGTLPPAGEFDLLLANLPYVAEPDWGGWRPRFATGSRARRCSAGADGLAAIRALARRGCGSSAGR